MVKKNCNIKYNKTTKKCKEKEQNSKMKKIGMKRLKNLKYQKVLNQ